MGKLKPCPFCGEEAMVYGASDHNGGEGFTASCTNLDCIAYGGGTLWVTEELAAERWNRRAAK